VCCWEIGARWKNQTTIRSIEYSTPILCHFVTQVIAEWTLARVHHRETMFLEVVKTIRFRLQTDLTAPSKFHSRLAVGIFLSRAFDLFSLNRVQIKPLRFRCDIELVVDGERSTAKSKKRGVTVWIRDFDDVQQVAFGLITVKILSILPIVDSDGFTDKGRCISGQLLDPRIAVCSLCEETSARNSSAALRASHC
jgi:hypothetical protein